MSRPAPASQPGMGAIPFPGGTAFRVWAPNAEAVSVIGSFNAWQAERSPLAAEGGGFWSADIDGAKVGDEYAFVLRNGSLVLRRCDPYAREIAMPGGNPVIHDRCFDWGDEVVAAPRPSELVVYQMYLGGDGAATDAISRPAASQTGPAGAVEHLEYLKGLGINAIELLAASECSGDRVWGFDPAHPYAPGIGRGAPRAFKAFVKAAHARGIAVFLGVAYDHFGLGEQDLWRFDGWSEDGKGGIYFYNDWRSTTPFGDLRPDYGRSEVRRYLRDNALMWLEDYRVDGLRWDAVARIRNVYGYNNDRGHDIADGYRLLQRINAEAAQRHPHKTNIAADMRDNPWLTKDTGAGGAGFDAQCDIRFVNSVRRAVTAAEDQDRDVQSVADAIAHSFNDDAWQRVIYTESHDQMCAAEARLPEAIWPGRAEGWYARKRSALAAALVLTSPGIPLLFQGQELLEDRWIHDGDAPLDWAKLERNEGIWRLYRDLIRLRRNGYDHTRGLSGAHIHVHHVNAGDKLLAFHRWDKGGPRDSVVVVANIANRAYASYSLGLPGGGRWKRRFDSDSHDYGADFGGVAGGDVDAKSEPMHQMSHSGSLAIGPYSLVILSRDE